MIPHLNIHNQKVRYLHCHNLGGGDEEEKKAGLQCLLDIF